MISPLIAETRSTDLEIERSAVGMIGVETESELLESTGSSTELEMLQLFMSVQIVAVTRPVIVIEPVSPLARSPALKVNAYQLKDQAEAYNHVIPEGKVSTMIVPVATLGQRLPYVIV